jgi:nitroreductase/NAD-dependent dihydropyrimidine dehydrogenase PreA subunit
MPAIRVDHQQCKRDGLCIATCPLGILEARADGIPSTRAGYETRCVACGHCMAVCQGDALLLDGVARAELQQLDVSKYPSPDALTHLMRGRRSIRRFRAEPLDRGVVEQLLDAARWAPSGHNSQPLRYAVFSGRERIHHLAELAIDHFRALLTTAPEAAQALGAGGLVKAWASGKDTVLRHAPQLLIAYGNKSNGMLSGSALIALTQVELLTTAMGFGACWAGYIMLASASHAPLRAALGLAEGEALAGALMIGKPNVKYRSIPPRKALDVRWE